MASLFTTAGLLLLSNAYNGCGLILGFKKITLAAPPW